MKWLPRILLVGAAVCIACTFLFPLWRFEIWAPQYPEGLFMEVWSYKLSGSVRSINILNHYVGMKAIEESAFWELRYFPYILAAFSVLALVISISNVRALLRPWAVLLIVFSIGALVDFYIWEYRFGHDLDPNAAIKMEDTAYQPPFIGSRTILNITAKSLPGLGSYFFGVGILLGVGAALLDWKIKKKSLAIGLMAALSLSACQGAGVTPLLFGHDACETCHMKITDKRFGFAVLQKKGREFKFDALDCFLAFARRADAQIRSVWVVDAFAAGKLIDVANASFAHIPDVRGPMGGVAVFASDNLKELTNAARGGRLISWNELLNQRAATASQ